MIDAPVTRKFSGAVKLEEVFTGLDGGCPQHLDLGVGGRPVVFKCQLKDNHKGPCRNAAANDAVCLTWDFRKFGR